MRIFKKIKDLFIRRKIANKYKNEIFLTCKLILREMNIDNGFTWDFNRFSFFEGTHPKGIIISVGFYEIYYFELISFNSHHPSFRVEAPNIEELNSLLLKVDCLKSYNRDQKLNRLLGDV